MKAGSQYGAMHAMWDLCYKGVDLGSLNGSLGDFSLVHNTRQHRNTTDARFFSFISAGKLMTCLITGPPGTVRTLIAGATSMTPSSTLVRTFPREN